MKSPGINLSLNQIILESKGQWSNSLKEEYNFTPQDSNELKTFVSQV